MPRYLARDELITLTRRSTQEASRVTDSIRRKLTNRKRRIQNRLRDRVWQDQLVPMFRASNTHYDVAERDRGLGVGGLGTMHWPARRTGLVRALANRVAVLT